MAEQVLDVGAVIFPFLFQEPFEQVLVGREIHRGLAMPETPGGSEASRAAGPLRLRMREENTPSRKDALPQRMT